MNRSNRNMNMENKKRGNGATSPQPTKQDIPKVTEHEIKRSGQRFQDEDYHLSQRRDDADRANALELTTLKPVYERKINFLKAVNSFVYLERKKIEDLETGKSYLIKQVERITTKYGDAIIAILQSPSSTHSQDCDVQSANQFKVFLPKRFLTRLSDDHLEYMNEGGIYLKFNGGKYNDLEFH